MFYETFVELCKLRGVSPSAVAEAIGASRKAASGWKNGSVPRNATMLKLAEYFGVSVECMKGNEKPAAISNGSSLDAELGALLHELTPDQALRVRDFVKGILSSR